jgi:BMFP domain-containing protein YqiC
LNLDSIKNEQNKKENMTLQEKISQALGRMDLLLKENFDLKREIVFERKKYVDLQQAYQDLRDTVNEGNDE